MHFDFFPLAHYQDVCSVHTEHEQSDLLLASSLKSPPCFLQSAPNQSCLVSDRLPKQVRNWLSHEARWAHIACSMAQDNEWAWILETLTRTAGHSLTTYHVSSLRTGASKQDLIWFLVHLYTAAIATSNFWYWNKVSWLYVLSRSCSLWSMRVWVRLMCTSVPSGHSACNTLPERMEGKCKGEDEKKKAKAPKGQNNWQKYETIRKRALTIHAGRKKGYNWKGKQRTWQKRKLWRAANILKHKKVRFPKRCFREKSK